MRSHRKGNAAELEVVKELQAWWRRVDSTALFVRTPRSGGWLAGRDAFGARGDVMVKTTIDFPWCVEVKRRERFDWNNVVAGKPSPVWGWWRRACDDARAASLSPMLWFRQSHWPWLVLMPRAEICELDRRVLLAVYGGVGRGRRVEGPWGGVAPALLHASILTGTPPLIWTRDPR